MEFVGSRRQLARRQNRLGGFEQPQEFDLEGILARRFSSLQNLVALASLGWALLAANQDEGRVLLKKVRRQKPNKKLQFPFYSLLSGWQQLFAPSATLGGVVHEAAPEPLCP